MEFDAVGFFFREKFEERITNRTREEKSVKGSRTRSRNDVRTETMEKLTLLISSESVAVENKRFDEPFHEHRALVREIHPLDSTPATPRARRFSPVEPRPSRRRNVDKGFNSVRMDQRAKIGRVDRTGWRRVAKGG